MRATISDTGMTLASTERKSSNRPIFLCLHFQPEAQLSHQSLFRELIIRQNTPPLALDLQRKRIVDRQIRISAPFRIMASQDDDGSMVRPIPAGRLPVDPDFTSEGLLRQSLFQEVRRGE
jgi:hypothetical protein